ncbi:MULTISPECIES: hypothetical protein [unclassified Flavobacterium]|jgi:hypothetical protein|uniref:hypothetical protein n=1 Tax=unclassified Flavobacterium TaxID=196869 RepID=UPI0007106CDA|nr:MULTISPECIES: hypothetical protein [unclassified Flavobacterium]KRD61497.1 hypothetical protein ASE40_08175 [Flavobacterium sp. Root935]TDX12632.1 hypothetical protein EDB96_1706 [Flavobacterium sp. S87F.05.LMB.W.Kidney.N]BDU27183.1 hypothetical protein FLGSB24_39270 [Flavobacterium sp. GSB-24]
MKQLFTLTIFLLTLTAFAQKPCEYSTNVTDSIGSYKITNEYLVNEKNFGGTSNYIFFSLAQTDGLPTLNVQLIQKSKEFIKANCFDKNSKIFLQLQNGKIVSLMHINQENCGTLIRDEKGFDNRVNTGIFLFMKDNYEELKKSPVTLMRVKYLTNIEDYIVKSELTSEMNGKVFHPNTYFMDNIRCVE